MDIFRLCLNAATVEEFKNQRQRLYQDNDFIANYVDTTYFNHWAHKLVPCFTGDMLHFGIVATSMAESSHRQMKSWL